MKLTDDEVDAVYDSIEDYIIENHRFCSIKEIVDATKINKKRSKDIIDHLIKENKIKEVYGEGNKVRICIPSYMLDEILRVQNKPRWVDKYSFDEKNEQLSEIKVLKESIKEYEMFERLLYTSGYSLEEAVAYAFKFLGFENVEHLEDKERHDVEFKFDQKLYLVEIKGKSKSCNKKDILQLSGWITKKIDEGIMQNELEGLFVINHDKNKDPEKRSDPLPNNAKEYLKYYNAKFVDTYYLYKIIKNVLDGNLNKDNARKKISEGQKIE